jgi:hypothetical protein
MEKWTAFKVITAIVALVVGASLLTMSITKEQRCYVWKNVDEKIQYNGYNVAIVVKGTGLMIPVDSDTYSFVKVNQSYNFYCKKNLLQNWGCHQSYECEEIKAGETRAEYIRD